MRVVFTGQMGMGKEQVLESFRASLLKDLGKDGSKTQEDILRILRVESFVAYTKTAERGWVQMPDVERQCQQWKNGFEDLLKEIEQHPSKNVFLSMHAVMYKNSHYISPVDWNLLRRFQPDLFISFIDDVIDIWWRINHGPNRQVSSEQFKLRELMAWRSAEIMKTDTLAKYLFPDSNRPHYVVAIKHPKETLRKLILKPRKLRVYAAYPITDAKKAKSNPEINYDIIREIDKNRSILHERYTVFDPVTIDEFELKMVLDKWKQNKSSEKITFIREEHRWPVRSDSFNKPLLSDAIDYPEEIEGIDPQEVDEITKDMSFQIQWRDFSLLDQVHCIAAYRPNFYRGSIGVQKELAYAANKGISAYQYWPLEDGQILRPFIDTGNFVTNYEDFLAYLEENQREIESDRRCFSHQSEFVGAS